MGEKTEDGNRRLIAGAGKNVYSDYGGVVPVKVDKRSFSGRGEETERICNIKVFPPIGAYNKKKADNRNSNLKRNGNIGELLVYNVLINEYGKDRVTPRSEAFIELGILKPGQASSGDYDISYKENDGKEIYVEESIWLCF